jgi:predicted alpha/beta hydrolase
MPIILAILAGLIVWALWSGKLRRQQLPPVLLGLAGAAIALRGSFFFGMGAVVVAATWYRGMTWRLFGLNSTQSQQYHIDRARWLLGVSAQDDAERIRAKHRKLMSENHPDVGGNDGRASALNEARDLLLASLENKHI